MQLVTSESERHLEHLECIINLTSRAGELSPKKRTQRAAGQMIGIGLRAREPYPWGVRVRREGP